MKVYKVRVKEGFTADVWLIRARSLGKAVRKAEKKRRKSKDLQSLDITSVEEMGELSE
jgi:hypothetical protein